MEPRSVLRLGVTTSVFLEFISNLRVSHAVSRVSTGLIFEKGIVLSIQIINVGSLNVSLHLGVCDEASRRVVVVQDMLEREGALVVVEFIQ